jgi:hypothetical protein
MRFLVKVKVNTAKLKAFGEILQNNGLDRSCIRGETFCLEEDPSIGFSIWEVESRNEFDEKFKSWREFYSEVDIREVVSAKDAMMRLFSSL